MSIKSWHCADARIRVPTPLHHVRARKRANTRSRPPLRLSGPLRRRSQFAQADSELAFVSGGRCRCARRDVKRVVRRRAVYSPSVTGSEGGKGPNLRPRAGRKPSLSRRGVRAGTALVLASASLGAGMPLATAAPSSDRHATRAYLIAWYKLVRALLHQAAAARSAEGAAAAQIARECPGVVSGMPHEPLQFPLRAPRVRGEDARLSRQKETIGEELDAAVEHPGDDLFRPAEQTYAAEVRRLSWSNPAIASSLQAATASTLEFLSAPAPAFCSDARAWAQNGFRALSVPSREFQAARAARTSAERGEGSLEMLLKHYESRSDRALVRKIKAIEYKLLAGDLSAVRTILHLKRTLGFPRAETEEPEGAKEVALGRGRTAAGTRFVVRSGSVPIGAAGCHRSATVMYSRPGAPELLIAGVPNNPICLAPPQYKHPAQFCEVGIETIQTAVPASVRSARLVLADGRTIATRVIRVPRRDGGPAGIYAQEISGTSSHAVSLVELNAEGHAVLTVGLRRYRCSKPHSHPEEALTSTQLATGHTPEGEAFTISAFGGIDEKPILSADIGVNPELGEPPIGLGVGTAFRWSLSIGCPPHSYAILYGILLPPGKSVTAQTPQGAVSLNVVPIKERVHAKGPLVYGVFATLPSELTVLSARGSIVHTENLQTKATEVAQFCEGYAEP